VKRDDQLRYACQFVLDALSGRLGVLMMTLAYASFAVVLLAYVSTQVYTDSLMEDISGRREAQRQAKEQIVRLTAQYASLASRSRIGGYCEDKLGMVQADAADVMRLSIATGDRSSLKAAEFHAQPAEIPDMIGSEIGSLSEVMKK